MDIEKLITPVLRKVCEYCSSKKNGYEVPEEVMLQEIRTELNTIAQRCQSMPLLMQQYQSIEKPLIFFIDYTIKEGGFTYSNTYKENARSFGELSGDDKFFDLLKNAMDLNEDKEVIRMFYLMMGLGFDGYYKRHRADMVEVLQNTAGELPSFIDFNKEKITPDVEPQVANQFGRSGVVLKRIRKWLVALLIVTVVTFAINYVSMLRAVSDFNSSIKTAVSSAQPYYAESVEKNNNQDQYKGDMENNNLLHQSVGGR